MIYCESRIELFMTAYPGAWLPRWLVYIGLTLFAALFLAAAPAHSAGAANVGIQLEPPNLDPTAGAAAAIDEIVYANIFEGLTRISADGSVAPGLAKSWRISPNGLVYDFTLRRNVRFHDGAMFDADDVVFTLDRARAPGSANAQRVIFETIKHVEALGPYDVRITLTEPVGALLTYLGWGDAIIVAPQSAATNATNPVGTGPFKFARWRKGASITLERNDAYWGEASPLEQINFIFIPDPAAAFAALMAGDVDGFPNYPAAENLALIEREDRFQIIRGTSEGEMIVAINNKAKPFDDIRVRRAISHAINRQTVIDAALFGNGTPIGSHFPPHHRAYIDLTGLYPYNPARARELLAQAGYRDGFSTTLTLPPPSYARRSGEVIAAQLSAIGVEVKIKNIEWAQWLDQVFTNKTYELTIVSHTEPIDIDIYARDGYYFQYANAEFNAIIKALRHENDDLRRDNLLKQAQEKIAHDAVNIFLAQSPKIAVWSSDVSGVWADAPVQANDLTKAAIKGRAALVKKDSTKRFPVPASLVLFVSLALILAGMVYYTRTSAVYLIQRTGSLLLSLFAATILVFLLVEAAPGGPAAFMMGLNADPASITALRRELGLDQPPLARYFGWVAGLAVGDFGISYTYRVPVGELIAERLWVSLPLALIAFAISTAIAIPAGVAAARYKNQPQGRIIMTAAQAGIAVPNFWLAILLVMIFSVTLRWFSAGGFPGWSDGAGPALKALLLPAIALALPQAAILTQIMRSSMLETLNEDYVRTARAKGAGHGRVLTHHALRNALIPVLTILGLQFSFLLAGSIIIENVFYLPGLGRLVFQSIVQRDLIVVQSIVMVLVFTVILVAFLVDLGYAIVDPRLRKARAK